MWTHIDANVWRRSDGWMIYEDRRGFWRASGPSGVLYDGAGEPREFGDPDAGKEFVDKFYRLVSN